MVRRVCGAFPLLLLLVLLTPAPAFAASDVRIAPVPAFAKLLPLPTPSDKRLRETSNGQYDLLDDTQVLSGPNRVETFYRSATKILDRSGLDDGARIQVKFDPSYEQLLVNRVAVRRDGQLLDRTASLRIDVVRQEGELDDGVLDGMLTAVIHVPEVRVGDIVDAAWTWRGAPPTAPNSLTARINLGRETPVGMIHLRITRLDAPFPNFHLANGAPKPSIALLPGGGRIYEWSVIDPDPIADDEKSPFWWRPWPAVDVSTYRSWAEVAAQAGARYTVDTDLPAAFAERVDAIAQAARSPEARAVRGLRLVQDEIRYTSLSIGPGSVVPRPPREVVESQFGDCKDKARLLVAVLGRLGVKAWPALTDSDEGATLPSRMPSEGAFDHAIVGIEIGGRIQWVDPTMTHQGGTLRDLAMLPYGWALPLRAGQASLMRVPQLPDDQPTMFVTEHHMQKGDAIILTVVTRYTRDEADIARRNFAAKPLATLEKDSLAYYRGYYPDVALARPFTISDDRDRNVVILRETYRIPAPLTDPKGLLAKYPINAYAVNELYDLPGDDARRAPVLLSFPLNRLHRIILDTPGYRPSAPIDEIIENAGVKFSIDSVRDGDRLTVDFRLVGKKPLLAAKDFAAFHKDYDRMADGGAWTLDLTGTVGMTDAAIERLVIILGLALVGLAAWWAVRDLRRPVPAGETLFPMPLVKYAALSVSTFGIYSLWWQWKNWDRIARLDSVSIRPFWRAMFSLFWFYALFARANTEARPALPLWIGGAAAAIYALLTLAGSAGDELQVGALALLGTVAPLWTLPAVVAVNRASDVATVRRNGHWSAPAVIGLIVGLPVLALYVIAATEART